LIKFYYVNRPQALRQPTGQQSRGDLPSNWPSPIRIDREYPAAEGAPGNVVRPEDTRNFTLLLAELRRQLDALGRRHHRHYLLTAALPAGADKIASIEVGRIHRWLDWLNLLTYDFHGPWEATGPAPDPELGAGTASYRTLAGFPGQAFRDRATRGFWKYDGTTFWAYDDPGVLRDKGSYVRARGLGGLYMWELSLDDQQATLVRTIEGALRPG
jgi:GH18 family chitinase